MPRADLLALSADDLATLSNRGTVKRAQKELESGEFTCEMREETGGDLLFIWSDGTQCRFPTGKTVHDAICSSGVTGISRHIVRSVLEYQRRAVATATPVASEPVEGEQSATDSTTVAAVESAAVSSAPPQSASWDPGTITDEALIAHFRKTAIANAQKRFAAGVLVELTRGHKPVARFLDDGYTVRFMVPDDLRYATADCTESLLSTWVPLAVWAFRQLPSDRLAGLLCLQPTALPVPKAALENVPPLVAELCRDGMSGIADSWSHRLARTEQTLRDEGLVWPAELAADLLHQFEMYRQHDARFEPRQLVQLVGELTIRSRAILSDTRAVPQLLVRGTKSDRASEIAGGRLIGVGLGVRPGKRHTTLNAYLQDSDSGAVVAVERTFADPEPDSKERIRSFAELAGTIVTKGVPLASLASSQLLLKSGKRTPSGQLILPRTSGSLTIHPQSYQWEHLKPPFAVENFAQLRARLETLPPSSLRPRRRTENLHIIAVSGADEVEFDHPRQSLVANLRDVEGETGVLVHPFHTRGREGFNDLTTALQQRREQVRFVCGHVRIASRSLEIQPVLVVLDDGQRRIGIQPWLPGNLASAPSDAPVAADAEEDPTPETSPIKELFDRLDDQLAELLLTGAARVQPALWSELTATAQQLGFVRLTAPIASLAESLSLRAGTLRWDSAPAVRQATELCLLSRLAGE